MRMPDFILIFLRGRGGVIFADDNVFVDGVVVVIIVVFVDIVVPVFFDGVVFVGVLVKVSDFRFLGSEEDELEAAFIAFATPATSFSDTDFDFIETEPSTFGIDEAL